jgi:uncharacterized protein YkwD
MKTRLARILVIASGVMMLAALPAAAQAATPKPAHTAAACAGANRVPTARTLARAERATLCLLNVRRAAHGLRALRASRLLGRSATRYARSLVRGRFFSHVSPSGQTLEARIAGSGYLRGANGWAYGENLAWGAGSRATPRSIVAAWMASPPHRANILSTRWRNIGVGIAPGAPVSGVAHAASYVTHFGWRG